MILAKCQSQRKKNTRIKYFFIHSQLATLATETKKSELDIDEFFLHKIGKEKYRTEKHQIVNRGMNHS